MKYIVFKTSSGKYGVKKEDGVRAIKTFDNEEDAKKYAEEMTKKSNQTTKKDNKTTSKSKSSTKQNNNLITKEVKKQKNTINIYRAHSTSYQLMCYDT